MSMKLEYVVFLIILFYVGTSLAQVLCPPLECSLVCDYGLVIDVDGCDECRCFDPCEKKYCPPETVCKAEQAMCLLQPCAPIVTCVPKCIPVGCKLGCPHGFAKDENGCEICACHDPCQKKFCPPGSVCKAEPAMCILPPCAPDVTCVPKCIPVGCKLKCPHGFAKDENGCEICACHDPCKKKSCPLGTVCKAEPAMCISQPCAPIVTCVPKCSPKACKLKCLHGFSKDANGCEICACHDPCQKMICKEGKVCKLVQVQCARAPCLPLPVCVTAAKDNKYKN